MKKIFLLILMASLMAFRSFCADEARGNINFENVPVEKVLEVYKPLSGRELVISSDLKGYHPGINLRLSDASKTEALKAIETALLEQAGVVITPLDNKRISVTFNDALPLTLAKK